MPESLVINASPLIFGVQVSPLAPLKKWLQANHIMNKIVTTLEAEARKLSPTTRLELVDAILNSLDEPDQHIDRLWSQEAEERLAAYRRGELKSVPLDEVLAKYQAP